MTNYTVNFILWKHDPKGNGKENGSGLLPIYLKITVDRKTSYLATGHFADTKSWDTKNQLLRDSHKLAKQINPELTHRKNEVVRKIVELQVQNKPITAKGLKQLFTGKDLNNIFEFIDAYCIEVQHKKSEDTIGVYERHKRKLLTFHKSTNLHFQDIDTNFLRRYEKHLRDEGAGNNYVHAIWKTLKAFFNAARKKKLIDFYPFDEYENPIYVDPEKDYLTLSDLKKLEAFADEETNDTLKQTAVYFLLGCYSGLRISDWKKFDINTHVEDDKIKLRAKKNGEWVTIPFSGPWARNVERMRVLPLTIEEPTLNEKIKIIAKKCGINKQLSSHCARKTFAVTMCADRGISLEVCATLMAITVTVCYKNYYRVTDHKIRAEVLKAWDGL